jgi:hypothetical protein
MNFNETLDYHLNALAKRDLDSFLETINKEKITLILPNGMMIKNYEHFSQFHKDWFLDTDWNITYTILNITTTSEMAMVLMSVNYSDLDQAGNIYRLTYYLNLVFEYQEGKWLLTFDQNTLFTELN